MGHWDPTGCRYRMMWYDIILGDDIFVLLIFHIYIHVVRWCNSLISKMQHREGHVWFMSLHTLPLKWFCLDKDTSLFKHLITYLIFEGTNRLYHKIIEFMLIIARNPYRWRLKWISRTNPYTYIYIYFMTSANSICSLIGRRFAEDAGSMRPVESIAK